MKHLTEKGQMWHKYLPLVNIVHIILLIPLIWQITLHMNWCLGENQSYYLIWRQIQTSKSQEHTKNITHNWVRRLQYLHKLLQDARTKRLALMNKDRDYFQYNSSRTSVYIISPLNSQLRTVSRKITIKYVDLLTVYKIIDPHN